jgi:FeS assembly SUF system protein
MQTHPLQFRPDPAGTDAAAPAPPSFPDDATLEEKVTLALKTVYDPEIPVDIHALGLIYALDIDADGVARIAMTLTAPACPVAGTLPEQVRRVVEAVPGIRAVTVELVWDPPWTQERMSDAARLELGLL